MYGTDANLDDYINYQLQDGSDVKSYTFKTTPEEDAQIIKRIEAKGGVMGGFCSTAVGEVLRGIGPFKNLEGTATPAGLSRELKQIKREAAGDARWTEKLDRALGGQWTIF